MTSVSVFFMLWAGTGRLKTSVSNAPKKWRGTRILHRVMTFSKKLPRVSDGFGILVWRVISSAHNLLTVDQTVRRKLHTTLNNICTVLTLTGIELRTQKSPYIQSVMLSTAEIKKKTVGDLNRKNSCYWVLAETIEFGLQKSNSGCIDSRFLSKLLR
jgi:hypothetical protein